MLPQESRSQSVKVIRLKPVNLTGGYGPELK